MVEICFGVGIVGGAVAGCGSGGAGLGGWCGVFVLKAAVDAGESGEIHVWS